MSTSKKMILALLFTGLLQSKTLPNNVISEVKPPQDIEFVSSISNSGIFKDICIVDTLIYCATGRGVEVINISDSKHPFSVASYASPGEGEGIFVDGDYVHLADGKEGLRILELIFAKDSTFFVEHSYVKLPGYAIDVVVVDKYIYVASCDSGLNIIDISPHSQLVNIKECLKGSIIRDIEIVGKYAYVVDYRVGLRISDISTPSAPQEVEIYQTSGMSSNVTLHDSLAFLISDRGLSIINISNPSTPVLISFYSEICKDIAIYGDYGYLISNDSLKVLNLTNLLKLESVSRFSIPQAYGISVRASTSRGVTSKHPLACVSCLRFGLTFFDISEPSNPILAGKYDPPGQVYDVKVSDSLLYVAKYEDGLEIVNLSDIKSPVIIGKYDTKGAAWAISDKIDFYTCVADDVGGVWTIDIKNPRKPKKLGYLDTHYTESARGYARGVSIDSNYAYIADHVGGLLALDISTPSNIKRVGRYQALEPVWDVNFSGPYGYLAEGNAGIELIDARIPSTPKSIGHYDTRGYSWSLDVYGNYCYVADGEMGLRIIDIGNHSEVGSFDTPGCAAGVKIVPPYAYIADGSEGVRIIDVSTPSRPFEIGHYDTPGYARRISVMYPYIFVADSYGGVIILKHNSLVKKNSKVVF